MIFLGYEEKDKRKEVQKALDSYKDVDRIYVFYGDKEVPDFNFEGYETIYTPYPETEKYRTFYPLLGQPYKGQNIPAITDKSLLIVDEFQVTKNRSDLKYNCTKHFLRVSPRHLVFNWFPIISEENDFMILMDMDNPDTFKGRSFDTSLLDHIELKGIKRLPEIMEQEMEITDKDKEHYEKKRDSLFEKIGQKDPDTIPRNLALLVGDLKKKDIRDDRMYVARNGRFKKSNVYPYDKAPESESFYLLDMHYRLKDFERFLRHSEAKELTYITTGLPVDRVFQELLNGWYDTVEDFYEKTGISK